MRFNWLDRILSRINTRGRRYRSEKAEFISSHALFYKVLSRDKKKDTKTKLKNKQPQSHEE